MMNIFVKFVAVITVFLTPGEYLYKIITLALIGTLSTILLDVANTSAKDILDKGPKYMILNAQKKYPDLIQIKDKKRVPNFPHHDHQDKYLKGNQQYNIFPYSDDWTCAACHHTTFQDQQPTSCFSCKDNFIMFDRVGGQRNFHLVFHKLCMDGCHAKMKEAKKKSGPVACDKCHT